MQTLLFVVDKAEFERTSFPDFLNQILEIEGNINTQAAEILSILVENNAIVNYLMVNTEYTYQVL